MQNQHQTNLLIDIERETKNIYESKVDLLLFVENVWWSIYR